MVFQNEILAGASGSIPTYQIDQSIRFNSADSAYLTRSPSSTGDQKKWTTSFWFKRCKTGATDYLMTGGQTSTNDGVCGVYINSSDDTIHTYFDTTGSSPYGSVNARKFRDPSAWYHFIWAVDAVNTVQRIWVNGEELTLDAGKNPPNFAYDMNATGSGKRMSFATQAWGHSTFANIYAAEIHHLDGQYITDPTTFGEYNDDGVWIPIEVSGVTYGTNGFYITGATAGDLGEDFSGNNNDFTSSGLAADDQVVDTPTDNYATLNPLNTVAPVVLSNGNLSGTYAGGAYQTATSGTISVNSGKWYWEVNVATVGASYIGLALADIRILGLEGTNTTFNSGDAYVYGMSGHKFNGVTAVAYGATYTSGDVVGVAFDADAGTLTFYKNNSSQGVAYTGLTSGPYMFIDFLYSGAVHNVNFGQLGFTHTPPVGFVALSTANLPTPAIADGSKYFQTTLYTATGSALEVNQIGNSTFQPDFVWVKNRTQASGQMINDAITGPQKFLRADNTDAQTTQAQGLVSFDADGFSVGTNGDFNNGTDSFVGWQWLAGNGTASNGNGSIASTVTANQTAGFSVISYTGNATGGATIGHGLSQAPEMVITKSLDNGTGRNWAVYHVVPGPTKYGELDNTNIFNTGSTRWNDTAPSSTVVTLGSQQTTNDNGSAMIAFCWHSVEGFSRFGGYTGNGSANGPFIHTGFRPAFVIFKRSNSADNWAMYDATRDPYNVAGKYLYGDTNAAETTYSTAKVDFLSNGFKWRGAVNFGNASGGTYVYMAFAEHPFGGDGVAPATAR